MLATDQLYETHCHTPLCKHAVGEPEEYARMAEFRGLAGIVITCHNPMPDGFSPRVRMEMEELDEYVRIVERARQEFFGRVDVRLGLEADYFQGFESFLDQQLNSHAFHYVLGSVHPQVKEYRDEFWHGDPLEFQRTYFEHLACAAETGLFDCISHPDLVKNLTKSYWDPPALMDDICRSLDRISRAGTAMELNTSGMLKTISEMNPFPEMLSEILRRDIPVVIGADAHNPARVGDGFVAALDLLQSLGFRHVHFFLERQIRRVDIATARRSLISDSANHNCQ